MSLASTATELDVALQDAPQMFGGTVIRIENCYNSLHKDVGTTRLLVIDPDHTAAAYVLSLFERTCWLTNRARTVELQRANGPLYCDCGRINEAQACCSVVDCLNTLRSVELSCVDVVICSTSLRDASGFDALAYIKQIKPEMPVIITSNDASLAVDAIRGGAIDFVLTTNLHDLRNLPLVVEKSLVHQRIKQDNERLQQELKRSLAELSSTNQQLQNVIAQLEMMARTDELTGLSNRRWFNLMLQGHWAEATRHDLPLACMLIDLDGFKHVNDKLGHHSGDDLLRLAAKVVRANCRGVDVPARYGGDEFCVLMGHTEPHEAAGVAKRILREFAYAAQQYQPVDPLNSQLGMSIGISHINLSRPVNAEQLVSHADEAMYAAKFAGKNRVMVRGKASVCSPM